MRAVLKQNLDGLGIEQYHCAG